MVDISTIIPLNPKDHQLTVKKSKMKIARAKIKNER